MVCSNMISDVLKLDYKHANDIFGKLLADVRGKTTRRGPERVETECVAVPEDLQEILKFFVLNVDIMFVSRLPYLATHSQRIGLVTTKYLPGWSAKFKAKSILKVVNILKLGVFTIQTLIGNEFNKLKEMLQDFIITEHEEF